MEVTLPSGRIVNVEKYDENQIIVTWKEGGIEHKLVLPKGLTAKEVDDKCQKYLYGYDDPETGEHVPGYFDLVKQEESESAEQTDQLIITNQTSE